MSLKTLVKVGNISNLSDARYCAGMGVDMLGFSVIAGQPHYLPPKLFQEIRGWVSGPKVVAELYGIQPEEDLSSIIQNYAPDYFEMDIQEYERLGTELTLPGIVSVRPSGIVQLNDKAPEYLLVDEGELASLKFTDHQVLLRVGSNNGLLEKLEHPMIRGIALNGTPEIRPGYKDYNALADILELLEV